MKNLLRAIALAGLLAGTLPAEGFYFIGNSLTAGIGLERLGWLAAQHNDPMEYGSQLKGDCKLSEHWQRIRQYGTDWGSGNTETAVYGDYPDALGKFQWDGLVLQPYMMWMETKDTVPNTYDYKAYGDRYSCDKFIGYARGDNPYVNVAAERIFIYGAWPNVLGIHYRNPDRPAGSLDSADPDFGNSFTGFTFKDFYELPYDSSGGGQFGQARETTPSTDFLRRLVDSLNADNADLPEPVRLIPAGAVLARLDSLIRHDALPGAEAYFIRHAGYYDTARFVDQSLSQFNAVPRENEPFDSAYGVMNFYADMIHLNDQSHSGAMHGTVGAYAAGVTVYTVLTGRDPRGTAVSSVDQGWYKLDQDLDAALIATVQQAVWDIVTTEPRTGVSGSTSMTRPAGSRTGKDIAVISSDNMITVTGSVNGLRLTDLSGHPVAVPVRPAAGKVAVDISRLEPGVYCLTCNGTDPVKIIRF